ncbi:hypothetical protein PPS11_20763 [Pseudomonas putida S11]|nr:hypothetical protein PPS11_20763 [Pseudomonas putida S11]
MVRVLAKDDHLHLVQRRRVERVEDQRPWRVDLFAGGVLAAQELAQLMHVGLVEFRAQGGLPAGFEFDAIVVSHGAFHKQWRDTR